MPQEAFQQGRIRLTLATAQGNDNAWVQGVRLCGGSWATAENQSSGSKPSLWALTVACDPGSHLDFHGYSSKAVTKTLA